MGDFDLNEFAEEIYEAHVQYYEARRRRDYAETLLEDQIAKVFVELKLNANEKLSVEDRKARTRADTDVIGCRIALEEEQKNMDNKKAHLEKVLAKKEMILDANATSREETKLGSLTT